MIAPDPASASARQAAARQFRSIFGLPIAADLHLPVLPCPLGPGLEIRVTALGDPRPPPDIAFASADRWVVTQQVDGLWLCREDIGAFLIDPDGDTVRYRPAADAAAAALGDALVDQVLPRALSQRGHLILHGASVACAGRVLALLGPSGTGKSTLTVACEMQGFTLLGDDSVRIVPGRDGARCISSYPGARLKPDSVASLGLTARVDPEPISLVPKHRYRPMADADIATDSRLQQLTTIVHLERDSDPARAMTLTPVPPAEAAALLTAQCFVLDPRDQGRIRRLLALTAATAAVVPVYRLRYPTGFKHLPAVCARLTALLDDLP